MKVSFWAEFASTVFLQPASDWFTFRLAWIIRNTFSLIGIRIGILWASAAHSAPIHNVSWVGANLSLNTGGLVNGAWNHICVALFAFVFCNKEVIACTSNE